MSFKLIFYETEDGTVPFCTFMDSVDSGHRSKILRDLDLLEKYGNNLREPYTKHLEDGIFELRSIFGHNISRSLFFFYTGNNIIITHGFIKKTRKTPIKELDKAKKYRNDWIRRNSK